MDRFDGRVASTAQILDRASLMPGRSFGELATISGLNVESSPRTKGRIGEAAEAFFGMKADSLPEPDFRVAGIELKTVPLRPRPDTLMVKERVYISIIDYHTLAGETWQTASVRRKVERILFVYYDWLPNAPLGDLKVADVVLWEPSAEVMRIFEADWRRIHELVRAGRAHEISEGDGSLLVAATKGPGGPPSRSQPASSILARQRAWALRPAFLRSVLESHRAGPRAAIEISTTLEDRALQALRRLAGKRVKDVEVELGLPASRAKHRAALVFQRAVATWAGCTHTELLDAGVDLRVVQADPSFMPYESLSFPAFRYQELIREDWTESELLSRLDRFLFVPIIGGKGLGEVGDCVVQAPFTWHPSETDLDLMEAEWTMFRDEIAAGRALSLTPRTRTQRLHVRPKGKDGLDTDPAPSVGPVVRKCFWFNLEFVADILRAEVRDAPQP